jgi:hypothetical protein
LAIKNPLDARIQRADEIAVLWLGQDFHTLSVIFFRRDLVGLVFCEQGLKLRLLGRGNRQ